MTNHFFGLMKTFKYIKIVYSKIDITNVWKYCVFNSNSMFPVKMYIKNNISYVYLKRHGETQTYNWPNIEFLHGCYILCIVWKDQLLKIYGDKSNGIYS